MLIVVVATASYADANKQIQQALDLADGIELRLDYFPNIDIAEIAVLRAVCTLPLIFTVRSMEQGGSYTKSEQKRLQDIFAIAALNPDYLDLEYHILAPIIQSIAEQYPAIKLIKSYHDFQTTPPNLMCLLENMQSPFCHAYKIVTYAQTTLDALQMLRFAQQHTKSYYLSAFCMGEAGVATRILAPIVGVWMTYTFLENAASVAAGQLSLQHLLHIYHYRNLNVATRVYALLGDPVHLSVGHLLHNQAMIYLKENAVYIKLCLSPDMLVSAWPFFQDKMWAGMSVTMPLKEKIVPFLETFAPYAADIQAINTVIRTSNHWHGDNTDGRGAWQALSQYLNAKPQTLLVLGAGGAARAIAYEAKRHGVKSLILNRTLHKAQCLANEVEGEAYEFSALNTLQSHYTIIINTLPINAYTTLSLQPYMLNSAAVAMDIVYQPIQTAFLQCAAKAGCHLVFGYEMYIHQALLQIQSWFQPTVPALEAIKLEMYQYFLHDH